METVFSSFTKIIDNLNEPNQMCNNAFSPFNFLHHTLQLYVIVKECKKEMKVRGVIIKALPVLRLLALIPCYFTNILIYIDFNKYCNGKTNTLWLIIDIWLCNLKYKSCQMACKYSVFLTSGVV